MGKRVGEIENSMKDLMDQVDNIKNKEKENK